MHLPAVDNPNNQHYFLNPVVKESIYNFKRKKYIYNFTQLRKTKNIYKSIAHLKNSFFDLFYF